MGAESELCLGLEATGLGREGAGAAGDVCEPRRRHTREAKKAATPSKAASALLPSLPPEGIGAGGARKPGTVLVPDSALLKASGINRQTRAETTWPGEW